MGGYVDCVNELVNWIRLNEYRGWDPYDGLNSDRLYRFIKNNRILCQLFIQFNKYSPVNFRPMLGVKKGVDLKGIALMANSYSRLLSVSEDEIIRNELNYCVNFIKMSSLKDETGYHSWASHYYPFRSIDGNDLVKTKPDIIGTSEVILAYVEAYKVTFDKELLIYVDDAVNYLVNCLLVEGDERSYFKYSEHEDNRIVLNASAKALEAISSYLSIKENDVLFSLCEKIVSFIIKMQNSDGSWPYSLYSDGRVRRQLDFHQGYVICGLLEFYNCSNQDEVLSAVLRGAEFYKNTQFKDDGTCYYRYPMYYPTDIHNQAQGIITFSKLSKIDPSYSCFAKEILEWTICNMKDESGYFYFQKWPFIVNKIPHMRWSQAWMLLALTNLPSVIE